LRLRHGARIHLHVHLPGVYADTDCDSNSYRHGNGDCNSYGNSAFNTDTHTNRNSKRYTEGYSPASAAPDSATATVTDDAHDPRLRLR
jgi:hypothetical protein